MAALSGKEMLVKTLLHESALANDKILLKMLLKNCWNKAKLMQDTCNEAKDTLLHITCRQGYIECTKILIENGINPDIRNENGNTPLHIAAKNGNGLILHLLFEAGAYPITKNNDENLPVDMTDNHDLKELLRQYSLKSAELQLMKKFNNLKEIIAEEERNEQYEIINQRYSDDYSNEKLPGDSALERIDSGICSDLDSNERLELECSEDSSNEPDKLSLGTREGQVLHISSVKIVPKAEIKRRLFRNNYGGTWNCSSFPSSSNVETKQECLVKMTSDNISASPRRRKSTGSGTRRGKRMTLPEFCMHGSTESYV